MKYSFIAMGDYYKTKSYGLVKTICRAIDVKTGDSLITFTKVEAGGIAGNTYAISVSDFKVEISE